MLKKILSITGRPGLFKIVGQGKNVIIVEELGTGKRFPAHVRDKIVSLGDIAMYTDSGDTPLGEIYDRLYAQTKGATLDVKSLIEKKELASRFEEIVPDYDKNRVYTSDLKKFFTWYNLLIEAGFTKFTAESEPAAEEKAED